jgi:hypothetical protein
MAHIFPVGERQTTLTEMAQVRQPLADEQDQAPDLTEAPTRPPAAEQIRPGIQQQRQTQPKDDDDNGLGRLQLAASQEESTWPRDLSGASGLKVMLTN